MSLTSTGERCTRCNKPLMWDDDQGTHYTKNDDTTIPDRLGIAIPCVLCENCVEEGNCDDNRK